MLTGTDLLNFELHRDRDISAMVRDPEFVGVLTRLRENAIDMRVMYKLSASCPENDEGDTAFAASEWAGCEREIAMIEKLLERIRREHS